VTWRFHAQSDYHLSTTVVLEQVYGLWAQTAAHGKPFSLLYLDDSKRLLEETGAEEGNLFRTP
jgi:hypothetical protein